MENIAIVNKGLFGSTKRVQDITWTVQEYYSYPSKVKHREFKHK